MKEILRRIEYSESATYRQNKINDESKFAKSIQTE